MFRPEMPFDMDTRCPVVFGTGQMPELIVQRRHGVDVGRPRATRRSHSVSDVAARFLINLLTARPEGHRVELRARFTRRAQVIICGSFMHTSPTQIISIRSLYIKQVVVSPTRSDHDKSQPSDHRPLTCWIP